jgi:hypothetical protein
MSHVPGSPYLKAHPQRKQRWLRDGCLREQTGTNPDLILLRYLGDS